ncbi:uncharacterized protein PHACADRAFT_254753 [Phanerochaete carnosa HHB-10118-sp]|uniref:Uncharacterized protein n=1 Tax=Phanerochaete carnosa (strain HHB-10118-sp) TaxID=650164 RepID=K5WD12_PHACS|nr:uncharacterized protein PHACADRAFT_254753 [Phanerochaete carnosa HHB-10118-sp]EKM57170.1 hypothetical protein PHACADRAFT_254753 [Phanerochaete carnosa HHB-10118-sp]
MNCTPYTHILCRDGRISQIRSWFLTDPEHGCMPFDFDWAEFDTLASRCHELAEVRMYLGPDRTYVAEFADGMTQRLRHVHGTGKLNIWYEGMEDEDEVWHTWKFNTHVDGDDA